MDNVGIAEYIKKLSEKARSKRILSASERQEILSDLARNTAEFAADRIRAIDTLNKMTGEYISRTELSGDLGVVIVDDVK